MDDEEAVGGGGLRDLLQCWGNCWVFRKLLGSGRKVVLGEVLGGAGKFFFFF